MGEVKKATCETCPWWDPFAKETRIEGFCRLAIHGRQPSRRHDEWCSEHPDRKLPGVRLQIASRLLSRWVGELTEDDVRVYANDPDNYVSTWAAIAAFRFADSLLAEAKSRQGGES